MQTIRDVSWLSKIKRKTPKMVHIKVKQELSDLSSTMMPHLRSQRDRKNFLLFYLFKIKNSWKWMKSIEKARRD